jgi:hypothetical protein
VSTPTAFDILTHTAYVHTYENYGTT